MILYTENNKESTKKKISTNKWIQQGRRLQDQYTKISCISLH